MAVAYVTADSNPGVQRHLKLHRQSKSSDSAVVFSVVLRMEAALPLLCQKKQLRSKWVKLTSGISRRAGSRRSYALSPFFIKK